MFGLAALAAVAAMAFVGASSASASNNTALCSANENPCSEANQLKSLHMALTPSTVGKLLNSTANVLCLTVLANGTVLGLGTAPNGQQIHVTEFNINGCGTDSGHNNCTVTATELPLLDLLNEGGNVGVLSALSGKTNIKCTIFGFIKIDCTYDGSGLEFEVEGGATGGMLTAEKSPASLIAGGGLCPEESFLDGLLQALGAAYITT